MRTLEDIEKYLAEQRELEKIRCPYCNEINWELSNPHDIEMDDLITYWAEGGPIEFECVYCEKTFMVKEKITRQFEVSPIDEKPPQPAEKETKQ